MRLGNGFDPLQNDSNLHGHSERAFKRKSCFCDSGEKGHLPESNLVRQPAEQYEKPVHLSQFTADVHSRYIVSRWRWENFILKLSFAFIALFTRYKVTTCTHVTRVFYSSRMKVCVFPIGFSDVFFFFVRLRGIHDFLATSELSCLLDMNL